MNDRIWTGRVDNEQQERLHQLVANTEISSITPCPQHDTFAFLGFASDIGIKRNQGRTGASEGPDAIRRVLGNLPIHRKNAHFYDLGNITPLNDDFETSQGDLTSSISKLLVKGVDPIILGGGHETAWGHFLGIASAYPGRNIALINLDAHLDMRPDKQPNSGTSFLQMAEHFENAGQPFCYTCIGLQRSANTSSLLETAASKEVFCIYADEIHLNGLHNSLNRLDWILETYDLIYFTICLDVFAMAYAPGVSAPQPLGLTPWQVIPMIRKLAISKKVKGVTIAELSPPYDTEGITARLAAALLSEWIHSRFLG